VLFFDGCFRLRLNCKGNKKEGYLPEIYSARRHALKKNRHIDKSPRLMNRYIKWIPFLPAAWLLISES
jgi:hypothetical protein